MWERGGSTEPSEGKGFPIFYCKPCIHFPKMITTSPPCQPGQALGSSRTACDSLVTPLSDLKVQAAQG